MDDMDTRLEAERPDVADVLRSMNWEERLERARARRKVVLTHNEATEKRPVVRIIDAAAVARKKTDAGETEAHSVAPAPGPQADNTAHNADAVLAPAEAPAKSSVFGRTALGFGLGLGLGTSLVAGAFIVFVALPGEVPVTDTPATATRAPTSESVAVQPDAVAEAPPPAEAPAAIPVVEAPVPQAGPAIASVGPDGFISPTDTAAPEGILPAAMPAPATIRAGGAQPSAPGEESMLAAAAPPAFAVIDELAVALQLPPRVTTPTAPDPWSDKRVSPRDPMAIPAAGLAPEAAPRWETAPGRPAPGVVSARLPDTVVASSDISVPGSFASVVPVAFPAPPGAVALPEGAPATSVAPPASPAVPHGIPDAERLFVRLAVPQTVPDAQAEEIAGLLRDVGVGDSRVARVGFKVSETHIRYYHAEDAAAAAALAEMVGTEARDRTSFRPSPPDGTVEIFLAGERTAPPPRAAAPQRARAQPPDELTRMRDRIVNRLRRGEHL